MIVFRSLVPSVAMLLLLVVACPALPESIEFYLAVIEPPPKPFEAAPQDLRCGDCPRIDWTDHFGREVRLRAQPKPIGSLGLQEIDSVRVEERVLQYPFHVVVALVAPPAGERLAQLWATGGYNILVQAGSEIIGITSATSRWSERVVLGQFPTRDAAEAAARSLGFDPTVASLTDEQRRQAQRRYREHIKPELAEVLCEDGQLLSEPPASVAPLFEELSANDPDFLAGLCD